ncbi:PTS sugar transporter subunit IIA [Streptomyces cuspidosporus]|uniref:Ascorbate-specific PTS system EIIA component n=1 Tax=Streptomyces cuspidosporus TaxID=66882 RepID=A0ABP5TDN9_9ACTN
MTQLTDFLSGEAIRLDVRAADWREAIGVAGGLMVATGVATGDYTAEMIANVEDNGPYVVIAPGLAFAHARPSPAVLRTGMSWVRLAEPVEFGHESNDPVELVVALAAKDSAAHTSAMAALARLLGDPDTAAALATAPTPEALLTILSGGAEPGPAAALAAAAPAAESAPVSGSAPAAAPASSLHKILTVCGNGVGTSLFLKNTLEQVLDRWKWSKFVTVEATDTISAKGKASEAVALLTSREIAKTLGDVGRPVKVVQDFTSTAEVDAALRDIYDVDTHDAETRVTETRVTDTRATETRATDTPDA